VTESSATVHDEIVARISHLPHVLAAVGAKVSLREEAERHLGGGGLRDTTRVAGGDAAMWTGILLENRQAVLAEMTRAKAELDELSALLEQADSEAIFSWLQEAKTSRDNLK